MLNNEYFVRCGLSEVTLLEIRSALNFSSTCYSKTYRRGQYSKRTNQMPLTLVIRTNQLQTLKLSALVIAIQLSWDLFSLKTSLQRL